MHTFDLVCLLIGAACFAAEACNVTARVNLLALGLLAWILVPLAHVIH